MSKKNKHKMSENFQSEKEEEKKVLNETAGEQDTAQQQEQEEVSVVLSTETRKPLLA